MRVIFLAEPTDDTPPKSEPDDESDRALGIREYLRRGHRCAQRQCNPCGKPEPRWRSSHPTIIGKPFRSKVGSRVARW